MQSVRLEMVLVQTLCEEWCGTISGICTRCTFKLCAELQAPCWQVPGRMQMPNVINIQSTYLQQSTQKMRKKKTKASQTKRNANRPYPWNTLYWTRLLQGMQILGVARSWTSSGHLTFKPGKHNSPPPSPTLEMFTETSTKNVKLNSSSYHAEFQNCT